MLSSRPTATLIVDIDVVTNRQHKYRLKAGQVFDLASGAPSGYLRIAINGEYADVESKYFVLGGVVIPPSIITVPVIVDKEMVPNKPDSLTVPILITGAIAALVILFRKRR